MSEEHPLSFVKSEPKTGISFSRDTKSITIIIEDEDIVDIGLDGTITVLKEGENKEAAKAFWNCVSEVIKEAL